MSLARNPRLLARAALAHVRGLAGGLFADVVLKTDGGGWILDQFSLQLQRALRGRLRVQVTPVVAPGRSRRVVHFIGGECFYDPNWMRRRPSSSAMIGLWWHGDEASPEPSIHEAARRIELISRQLARVHVTCSISAEIVRRLGVPENRIALVPMGVDLELFRPPASEAERARARAQLGLPADALVIGSFQKDGSGWGDGEEPKRVKGPDVFAAVVGRLAERYRIVALIPGPARGYLKRQLADRGVAFRNDGFVPFRALRPYYHACDLYLMTGREEGGPAAVLEALACGVPLVAHRSGMAPDVIADGVTGYLADVDDVDALVTKTDRLLSDRRLRNEFAHAALPVVRSYAWPEIARRYQRLYESVRPS